MCNGISPVEDTKKDDFEDLKGNHHWGLNENALYTLCGIAINDEKPSNTGGVNCVECIDRAKSYGY